MQKFDKELWCFLFGALIIAFSITGAILYIQPRVKEIRKEKAEIIKIYTHDASFMGQDSVHTVFQFKDGTTKTVRGVRGKEGQFYTIEHIYYEEGD